MYDKLILLTAFLGLEFCALFADYFIKKASLQVNYEGWASLLLGAVIYGASAVGWFILMRSFKLFTLGVLHSLLVIILTLLLSLIVFKEKMNQSEALGVILGCASMLLLLSSSDE